MADKKNHKSKKLKETVGTAYYIAPEVLQSEYDEKCDTWSIGVILYTMLSGLPPFFGENELEIVKKVRLGIYDLNIPELENVSIEAKELISQMLMYDPKQRPSVDSCL
jgi:calcium-dependent protein kinase